jgi:hypothetical protein
MTAAPGATAGAGRSTQRCGSCGGPADLAPKRGQPTTTQAQPPWRKTRFARCGGSRLMDAPERRAEPGMGQ